MTKLFGCETCNRLPKQKGGDLFPDCWAYVKKKNDRINTCLSLPVVYV